MTRTPTDADGELRKRAAHAQLEARRAALVRRARRALLKAMLADGRGQATADDVRSSVELPPEVNPVCLGCVPSSLVAAGIITRAGYRPSLRAAGHARPVTIWQLIDRAAARRWLAEHPAPEGDAEPALFSGPNITLRKKDSSYDRF